MAEEYQSAEVYEAQFFQMPTEDEMATLDDRPLKIMNLTKRMSNKNNFLSELDESRTNIEEVTNTEYEEPFVNEPQFQDYNPQKWPSTDNLKITNGFITPNTFTNQSANNTTSFYGSKQFKTTEIADFTEVYVWGSDNNGQLGIDSQFKCESGQTKKRPNFHTLPRPCCFNVVIKQVSCGFSHAALLTIQGHLYMMGSNSKGQLGIGKTTLTPINGSQSADRVGSPCLVESLREFEVEQVSCGHDFTFAVLREVQSGNLLLGSQTNSVYSWGNNSKGQLAQPVSTRQSYLPIKVQSLAVLEDNIEQVSCGFEHVLILTSQLDVISCGNNKFGQCGFDPAECNQTDQPFKITGLEGHEIVQVSAGSKHSLFLSSEGKVFAAGSNTEFQIGVGLDLDQTQTPVQVQSIDGVIVSKVAASHTSACITAQGELYIWGKGAQGSEIILPQKVVTVSNAVVDISVGESSSLVLDSEGMVWSWGNNGQGELGLGDVLYRPHPFPIMSLQQKGVTQLATGGSFAICLGQNVVKQETLNQDIIVQEPTTFTFKIKKKQSQERKSRPTSQHRSSKENVRPRSNSKSMNPDKPPSTKHANVKRSKSGSGLNQLRTPRENQPSTPVVAAQDSALVDQVKRLKLINNVLKQELAKQSATIQRLECKITKLSANRSNQQQVIDLQLEVKRLDHKLKKSREKRRMIKDRTAAAQQNIDQFQIQIEELSSQLKNTQLKFQRVNDESYSYKVESNSKDAVISELELRINQQATQIEQLTSDKQKSEDTLKSTTRKMQDEQNIQNHNLQNTTHMKLQLTRDLQNLQEYVKKRDEYIQSIEQENAKLRQDLSLQKEMKRGYESFVSGLAISNDNRPQSTTSLQRKDHIIIEKQIQVEEEALQRLQQRPKSHLSQNSAEQIERKTPKETTSRQQLSYKVDSNYKSFLALTEPLQNNKTDQKPTCNEQCKQVVSQPALPVQKREPVSLRDQYSEKLIKSLEAKAQAKQRLMHSNDSFHSQ